MLRLAGAFFLICLHARYVHGGMDCSFGQTKNFWEKPFTSCPGMLDPDENSFCCFDLANERAYCCNAEKFAVQTGLNIVIPVAIAAAVVISLIVCCISCLCCSCCPWYRRRHQGTVYGKVQTPVVQVIQPQANLPPSYTSQAVSHPNPYPMNPPYPTSVTGMPQPPPYTSEVYAKQAPYNPAYPPPSQ